MHSPLIPDFKEAFNSLLFLSPRIIQKTSIVMAPIDSLIKTSSDAWATLIANIASLLILVGKKHVKDRIFLRRCRTFLINYSSRSA